MKTNSLMMQYGTLLCSFITTNVTMRQGSRKLVPDKNQFLDPCHEFAGKILPHYYHSPFCKAEGPWSTSSTSCGKWREEMLKNLSCDLKTRFMMVIKLGLSLVRTSLLCTGVQRLDYSINVYSITLYLYMH
jgi:hypothetical protein